MGESALEKIVSLDPFPQPAIIQVKYPVVLMHGFGMAGSFRRNGHMHELAMHLRARGIWAYAPNVTPYNPVPVRASIWQQRIQYVLNETGAEKVNLIAHSMGGLDARYLISVSGFHSRVASLTTIATPHHGSSIASFLLEQPEKLREWLNDLANWMGTKVMPEVEADFINTVSELTPTHLEETFNPKVPDHPEVLYWSYAAQAGKETSVGITPILKPLNYILFGREGTNDGFVSIESAKWGTYCGLVNADHAQQIGLNFPTTRSSFDCNQFFCTLAKNLAAAGC